MATKLTKLLIVLIIRAVGCMLERYKTFHPKPKNIDERKEHSTVNLGPVVAAPSQQGQIFTWLS